MFPLVWSVLYGMMGWSSYLIWRDGGGFQGKAKWPLILYITNLLFNWTFSLVFFVGHQLKQVTTFHVNIQSINKVIHFIQAFFLIFILAVNVAACFYTFKPINSTAAYFLVPYFAWTTFATLLSYRIWRDNPTKRTQE